MKFRSKRLAWLVAAPAAWISGCGLGPISGLHRESAVISLRQPDPLAAMQRSTSIVGVSPEEGAFSTADLQGLNPDDPEGFRLLQLTAARRRANQQMMMQMMMQPMLVPQVQQQQPQHRPSTPSSGSSSSSTAQKRPTSPTTSGPSASTAGKSSGSSSSSTTARTTAPRPTTPPPAAMPVNPLLMNPYLLGEMPPLAGGRRPSRADIRENRAHRTENATTVEANRIERAAAAEAERAEKAALAEAQLAERRLLAEAEIVERMTRAETELAERLAAAKDERDRRIEIARQERELRFAILGLDANELEHDPAADALARFSKTKPATNDEVSAFTRFTRFLRTRTDEQDRSGGDRSPSHEANRKGPAAEDLPERLRDAADALQDPRTLAQAASRLPSGEPERAPREEVWPEATSTAQNSASRAPVENLHPSLLGNSRTPVQEEIFNRATAEPQQPVASAGEGRRWSPLDDLIQPASASGISSNGGDRVAGGSPPAFPESFAAPAERTPSAVDLLLSNQSAGTRDAAESTPQSPATAARTDAPSTASNASGRKTPENDLWILGGRGPNEPAPVGGGQAAEFPANASIAEQDPSRYTQPGGLYGEVRTPSTPPVAQRSLASAAQDAPSRHSLLDDVWATSPQFASGGAPTRDEPVDPAFVAQSAAPSAAIEPASDPWLLNEAAPPVVAQAVEVQTPAASGFPSRNEPASTGFMLPTLPQPVQQTAWTQKSLLDVCGPLSGDLEALVTQLDIPEAGVRKEVLHDLGQLGNRARPALPAIRVLLEDHPLIAAHAAWTIWNITQDEQEVTRELMRLLQSGQPEVVQFSAYALGSLGAKALSAAPALQIERERFNGATRIHVAEALTRIDAFDEASVQVLTSSLTSSEPHLRWLAALSLGHVQTRHAATVVPALAGALLDPDPEVRSAAALSLGGFGSAAMIAVPELQRRATLDAPNVREAAQTALACIRK